MAILPESTNSLITKEKLMDEIGYKGFTIEADPQQLTGNNQWTVNIFIWMHRGGSSTDKQFTASQKFSSKEEATKHCFEYGKQIIDGKIPNSSVDDL